jgi:hypothetical protein
MSDLPAILKGGFFGIDDLDNQSFTDISKFDDNIKFLFIEGETDNRIERRDTSFLLSRNFGKFYYNPNNIIDLSDINDPPAYNQGAVNNNDTTYMDFVAMKKVIYIPIHINNDGSDQVLILLYEIELPKIGSDTETNKDLKSNDENFKTCVYALSDLVTDQLITVKNQGIDLFRSRKNLAAFMSATGRKQINETDEVSITPGTENVVNNPIVKSFESTMGEGLAGTISEFSIGFERDIPWELKDGSRAPIAVKITLGMSVIHDILPGLDSKGIMTAPTYRVGDINRNLFGASVYEELGNYDSYTNGIVEKK